MNKRNQRAFTLFELLVSISIIGILTALGVVSFSGAQKKARDARRVQDMNLVQKAAEMYYSLNQYVYPISGNSGEKWQTDSGQTVLESFPTDPKDTDDYVYSFTPNKPGVGDYCACAYLEAETGGNANTTDCSAFVNGTGVYYCVKNQQ